jgi:hypothetical protein
MRILKGWMKLVAWVLGLCCVGLLAMYVVLSSMIGLAVDNRSKEAMQRFGGDRVEALIAQVDCQTCSLHERTQAVWALGQLADKRALPVLRKYYTGQPCDHRRLICQHEITKAIRWTEGKSFMLPSIWRGMLSNSRTASKVTPP